MSPQRVTDMMLSPCPPISLLSSLANFYRQHHHGSEHPPCLPPPPFSSSFSLDFLVFSLCLFSLYMAAVGPPFLSSAKSSASHAFLQNLLPAISRFPKPMKVSGWSLLFVCFVAFYLMQGSHVVRDNLRLLPLPLLPPRCWDYRS